MTHDGASLVKIAQEKKMNESTVRSIYTKREDVHAKGMSGFQHFLKEICDGIVAIQKILNLKGDSLVL